MFKIYAFNGTVWETTTNMLISEAVTKFCKDTGHHEMDIKFIERLN